MGESKRRKQSDPNYGKLPKSSGYRGLVVSPPITVSGSSLSARSTVLDPLELRFSLLFWDYLVWPRSRAIYFASGPDEKFLEDAKILRRPEYTFQGDIAEGIARTQYQAFRDLEQSEPGVWALVQGENSFLYKTGSFEQGRGAFVELHRAIPIPKHDVPLAEVLEFKTKRRDELLLMRHQLESFVAELSRSDDRPSELKKRISEIDEACRNLLILGKEWQFPVHLSNLKATFSFNPTKLLPAVGAAWKLAEPYGLTAATTAAGVAGLASTLEVKADYGLRAARRPHSPYRYAYQIERELK